MGMFYPHMGLSIGGFNLNFLEIVFYIVNSFAFYKIAKIRGIQYPWLAFIPVFNLYMIGVVGDSLKYTNYTINKYFERVPLALALPLGYLVISYLRFPYIISKGLFAFITLIVMYLIFDFYDTKNKILFTIVCIFPFMQGILILYVTRKIKL